MSDVVADAYDDAARTYDDHYTGRLERAEDKAIAAILAEFCDGRCVLDLGCGTGLVRSLTKPHSYHGIDVSAGMLARARARWPLAHFTLADLDLGLPLQRSYGRIDVVTSLWAWSHLLNPAQVAADIARVGRTGTKVIIQAHAERSRGKMSAIVDFASVPMRFHTPSTLAAPFDSSVYSDVKVRGFRYLPDELARRLARTGSMMVAGHFSLPASYAQTLILEATVR